jgi:hypothetical protein
LQKKRRNRHDIDETVSKKLRSDSGARPSGTSESGKSKELETEEPERPQKQAPRVQSAIYASQKISSSFDVSHTINLTLVGMCSGL